MMYILLYLVVGVVLMFCTVWIHMASALRKGYCVIEWWEENGPSCWCIKIPTIRFAFGLLIWPVRIVQFIRNIPQLYDAYESLKNESVL